jgi:hypothetical protein
MNNGGWLAWKTLATLERYTIDLHADKNVRRITDVLEGDSALTALVLPRSAPGLPRFNRLPRFNARFNGLHFRLLRFDELPEMRRAPPSAGDLREQTFQFLLKIHFSKQFFLLRQMGKAKAKTAGKTAGKKSKAKTRKPHEEWQQAVRGSKTAAASFAARDLGAASRALLTRKGQRYLLKIRKLPFQAQAPAGGEWQIHNGRRWRKLSAKFQRSLHQHLQAEFRKTGERQPLLTLGPGRGVNLARMEFAENHRLLSLRWTKPHATIQEFLSANVGFLPTRSVEVFDNESLRNSFQFRRTGTFAFHGTQATSAKRIRAVGFDPQKRRWRLRCDFHADTLRLPLRYGKHVVVSELGKHTFEAGPRHVRTVAHSHLELPQAILEFRQDFTLP